MGKPKNKLTDPVTTRLDEEDAKWLEHWCEEAGQRDSDVLRGALRLLRVVTRDMPEWSRAKMISTMFSRVRQIGEQSEEFWTAASLFLATRKDGKRSK